MESTNCFNQNKFNNKDLRRIANEWGQYPMNGTDEQAALRTVERLAAKGDPEALALKIEMIALRLKGYGDANEAQHQA